MAFFNITQLGSQDPFRTASGNIPSLNLSSSQTETLQPCCPPDKKNEEKRQASDACGVKLQASASRSGTTDCCGRALGTPSHTERMYYDGKPTGNSGRGGDLSWQQGSFEVLTYHLQKHQRNPKGPNELYQQRLTTSQQYGWWMKHTAPHAAGGGLSDGGPGPGDYSPSWTEGERHFHVNSEMTRFVDEMSLTNRDFSLF